MNEVKEILKKQNDEKFDNLRRANEDLKKEHKKEIEILKKDIIEEVKELLKKQNDKKNEDLKKEHGKEIKLLKREFMDLKEKLHAKTATDETNDSLNFSKFA